MNLDLFGPSPLDQMDRVLEFFSGVASPAIWSGYESARAPMCLVVGDLSKTGVVRARRYAAAGGVLLLDSGAFIYRETPERVDWPSVLGRYAQIADCARGGEVLLVLPDVVGNQEGTLSLAARYQHEIASLRASGAKLLLPMQRGALSFEAFYAAYCDAAGISPDGLALPSNAAALSEEDLAEILRLRSVPRRLHFLGVSKTAARLAPRVLRVFDAWPDAAVSCDACVHRAYVGAARPITRHRREALRELVEEERAVFDETEDHEGSEATRAAFADAFPNADEAELDDLVCSGWGVVQHEQIIGQKLSRAMGPAATAASIKGFALNRQAEKIPEIAIGAL